MTSHRPLDDQQITIRRLSEADRAEVARLAQRDSAREPQGELLGAEVGGELIAAISLKTRELAADPFRPSAAAAALLELRAAQLAGEGGRNVRRGRSRLRLGGSPPGASTRIFELLRPSA